MPFVIVQYIVRQVFIKDTRLWDVYVQDVFGVGFEMHYYEWVGMGHSDPKVSFKFLWRKWQLLLCLAYWSIEVADSVSIEMIFLYDILELASS